MLAIAAPVVVTMTSYTVMGFIDGLMASRIGPEPVYVAAQGNGGLAIWVVMAACFGVLTIVNTFVSQNLGAGRPERGSAYAWNGLWLALAAAVLMLPYLLVLPTIFREMGHSGDLLRMELEYARVLGAGAWFTLAARTLGHYFYGIHKPVVPMIAALVANVVNVVANAVLIFGESGPPEGTPLAGVFRGIAAAFDVPALGVRGAAIGTVFASLIEAAIPMAVFLSRRMHARYATRSAWRPSRTHVKDILRVGWPGGLMMGNEVVCWGLLMAFLLSAGGRAAARAAGLDDAAIEAEGVLQNNVGWIGLRYMHTSFMPAVGISIAVTAMVGKCIGMGRPDLAARRAWVGLGVTMAYMGACALAFALFGPWLVDQFISGETPPEVRERMIEVGAAVMIAAAVFQVFDAFGVVLSGALRGAGDTVWPGVVTFVLSWSIIVGMGYAMIELAPTLGSIGPWIAATVYIIALGLAMLARFFGGKWRSMSLVREEPLADGLDDPRTGPVREGQEVAAGLQASAGGTPGGA
jgi:MATE family multidrug resistance protein